MYYLAHLLKEVSASALAPCKKLFSPLRFKKTSFVSFARNTSINKYLLGSSLAPVV